MKILFKTVCYQGRGRDRFQHSSALLPGKGGTGLCTEPPAILRSRLEKGHRIPGTPLMDCPQGSNRVTLPLTAQERRARRFPPLEPWGCHVEHGAFQESQNLGPERPWRRLNPGALYLSGRADDLVCFQGSQCPGQTPRPSKSGGDPRQR